MRNVVVAALLVGLCPSLSPALEIKNVRPTFGPSGAIRGEVKALPGDFVFLSYDIEGLAVEKETGKASYVTSLELLDPTGKSLFKKDTPVDLILQLGGTRVPGDLYITTGPKQAPGKYTIKLTVTDKRAKDESKAITYPFELIPESFGFVGILAPTLGIPGQNYVAQFNVVNMGLDSKKQPNVDIGMRVLDEQGKPVSSPVYSRLPKDIPEGIDVQKENIVPLSYPLYLNRPGRFTVEISAKDNVAKKDASVRYTLMVVDLATLSR
jgi:hypothetical protein